MLTQSPLPRYSFHCGKSHAMEPRGCTNVTSFAYVCLALTSTQAPPGNQIYQGTNQMAQASVIWLEAASECEKTEELLRAKVFVSSCSSLGVESKRIITLQDVDSNLESAANLVLIAGEAGSRRKTFFLDLAKKLRQAGRNPIFIMDALSGLNKSKKSNLISSLEKEQIHTTTQESAIHLLRTPPEVLQLLL